jgi:hypothetical protein
MLPEMKEVYSTAWITNEILLMSRTTFILQFWLYFLDTNLLTYLTLPIVVDFFFAFGVSAMGLEAPHPSFNDRLEATMNDFPAKLLFVSFGYRMIFVSVGIFMT